MNPDVMKKFLFEECEETRIWEELVSESPLNFKTGGLHMIPEANQEQWGVWACWKDHPCLLRLSNVVHGDYMCYVYNELENTWHAWGIKREVEQQAACSAANFR